ncbi:hypothetical protein ACLOJK_033313 [Asimina triloba]
MTLGSSSSRLDWSALHPISFGSDDQSHLMMTMMHPSAGQAANAHPSLLPGGDGAHPPSDPHHLTCLKLGKRHYFEERHVPGLKRGRALSVPSGSAPVPRCQVEGCHVALLNAKDYHRRHKVCEMHSKAPRVVVLGIEQRFCQQCSRWVSRGIGVRRLEEELQEEIGRSQRTEEKERKRICSK